MLELASHMSLGGIVLKILDSAVLMLTVGVALVINWVELIAQYFPNC